MNFSPDSITLIVGLVLLAGTSVFGFLVRKAFGDLTEGLKEVSTKLDALNSSLHLSSTEIAVLRTRVDRMEAEHMQIFRDAAAR